MTTVTLFTPYTGRACPSLTPIINFHCFPAPLFLWAHTCSPLFVRFGTTAIVADDEDRFSVTAAGPEGHFVVAHVMLLVRMKLKKKGGQKEKRHGVLWEGRGRKLKGCEWQ